MLVLASTARDVSLSMTLVTSSGVSLLWDRKISKRSSIYYVVAYILRSHARFQRVREWWLGSASSHCSVQSTGSRFPLQPQRHTR